MAYLALEAMDVPRVRTELSVAYIDHNTLQCGFENADDHRYIQSVARKYGVRFSRPGNGICHQVHLERFGKPGKTLIGSDSHTPTGGALGMLALGAGGMDVAVAMAGGAYYIDMPRMFKVNLTGRLQPWVSAKDVSLEICASSACAAAAGPSSSGAARASRRSACRSAPPSPTWAPSWAPRRRSSPPTRSPNRSCARRGARRTTFPSPAIRTPSMTA